MFRPTWPRTWPTIWLFAIVACGGEPESRAAEPNIRETPQHTARAQQTSSAAETPSPSPSPEEEQEQEQEQEQEPTTPSLPLAATQDTVSPATRVALLASARRALHAGEHTVAIAGFGRLLRQFPRARRLWCESGYVYHRSGNDFRAARHLDHGLRLFSVGTPSEEIRVPHAMCLYNRGLVHQAAGELAAAEQRYEASLALRPNRTVARHLAEVRGRPPQTAPVAAGATSLPEDLDIRLSESFVASNDFDEMELELGEVTLMGTLSMGGTAGEVSVWLVVENSVPLGSQFLVVAFSSPNGPKVVSLRTGSYDTADLGRAEDSQIREVENLRLDHGLVRADLTGESSESYQAETGDCILDEHQPTTLDTSVLLCDPARYRCVLVPTSLEVTAPGSQEYIGCDDPPETTPPASPAEFRIGLRVQSDRHLDLWALSGGPAFLGELAEPVDGHWHPIWDEAGGQTLREFELASLPR